MLPAWASLTIALLATGLGAILPRRRVFNPADLIATIGIAVFVAATLLRRTRAGIAAEFGSAAVITRRDATIKGCD